MRDLFGIRLDQLTRIKGLVPEAVVARLVSDMVEATGSRTFDADEMGALRGLLEKGVVDMGPDPVKATQLAVSLLVMASTGDRVYVPPIDTLRDQINQNKRRAAEEAEKAARKARAQQNTDWAQFINSKLGDGFGPNAQKFWQTGSGTFTGTFAQAFAGQPNAATTAAMSRLGLAAGFTTEDLKKAYRERAKKVHPDVGGSAEAFQELTKDNELLEKVALELK